MITQLIPKVFVQAGSISPGGVFKDGNGLPWIVSRSS